MREGINKILTPQFGRVHIHFPRRRFDNAFDQVGGFRSAGTAVGIDWHRVGVYRLNGAVDVLDVVLTRQQCGVQIGGYGAREERHVGTQVSHGIYLKAGDNAVCIKANLCFRYMITTVCISQERFRAISSPFDGPIGFH